MRQYVIDQLKPEERDKIKAYLEQYCEPAGLDGMFWLHVPLEVLSETQRDHQGCQPHCVGIELREQEVKIEFLVRSRNKIRCECIAYALPHQRDYIINFIEQMLKETKVKA